MRRIPRYSECCAIYPVFESLIDMCVSRSLCNAYCLHRVAKWQVLLATFRRRVTFMQSILACTPTASLELDATCYVYNLDIQLPIVAYFTEWFQPLIMLREQRHGCCKIMWKCMFCGVMLFLSQLVLLLLTILRVCICDELCEWSLVPVIGVFSSWMMFCEYCGSKYVSRIALHCMSVANRLVLYILLMVTLHSHLLSIIFVRSFIRIFSLLYYIPSFVAC